MSPMAKTGQSVKIRLDKLLSSQGLGSRKEVLKLIKQGRVKVNQVTITKPDTKVNPSKDLVQVDGKEIVWKRHLYYKLYKPSGYITSASDKDGPCVLELLPEKLSKLKGLFPVGRLDKDAEGLLLFTNNGELAHRILHPKWKLPKVYEVKLDKPLEEKAKRTIELGVKLKEGLTKPAKVKVLSEDASLVKITVYEGRYHLIKRLFASQEYRVIRLKRIQVGCISLEDMKPGELRELSSIEVKELKSLLKLSTEVL